MVEMSVLNELARSYEARLAQERERAIRAEAAVGRALLICEEWDRYSKGPSPSSVRIRQALVLEEVPVHSLSQEPAKPEGQEPTGPEEGGRPDWVQSVPEQAQRRP